MVCPDPEDPNQHPLDPSKDANASDQQSFSGLCVRCRERLPVILIRESEYCEICAVGVFYQKIRPGLDLARGAGLEKFIQRYRETSLGQVSHGRDTRQAESANANVALAFSGGPSSRALLRAARNYFRPHADQQASAVDPDRGKGLSSTSAAAHLLAERTSEVARIDVIYIDDSAVIPNVSGRDLTEEARAIVESEGSDFNFVPLKLEDVFSEEGSEACIGVECCMRPGPSAPRYVSKKKSAPANISRKDALRELFSAINPAHTPRTAVSSARTRSEDLHRLLIRRLLTETARKRNCVALLLGESGTRMSIRLIESLSKGGGHKLPVEGSGGIWIQELMVVRPLKEHVIKEIEFFNTLNGLEPLPAQDLVPSAIPPGVALNAGGEPLMDKSSIARLTETFILNLEKGVVSTVSTIGRTGSKLVFQDEEILSQGPGKIASPSAVKKYSAVGPSVPLPLRVRSGDERNKAKSEDSLSSRIANVSIAQEPRIGGKGSRLAQTAREAPRWNEYFSCPLCCMPSRSGVKEWKEGITISSMEKLKRFYETQTVSPKEREGTEDGDAASPSGGIDSIDLTSLLCYACILVLETPERPLLGGAHLENNSSSSLQGDNDDKVLLPPYVLQKALQRLKGDAEGEIEIPSSDRMNQELNESKDQDLNYSADDSADTGRRLGAKARVGQNRKIPRKVGQDEMREKIGGFLLEE
ncbi:hypothetical protein IE53DRAFT_309700 [Violaceomyces palustris]|uniref:Uncharacterized protein n=1 Tax=Violaceomyces palustris TaxID=1673888 RepID=A0ACD0P6Q7_9BASI|nr:hypothetical protein IE53DRAFT_309700 [Violaceomyces palustris]